MLTLVGSECSSFERGREQMKLLAGLEVTTKAVERTTECIGAASCMASCIIESLPTQGVVFF
jgi:coenzyme F420-reducing hydrogenase gamma subunit